MSSISPGSSSNSFRTFEDHFSQDSEFEDDDNPSPTNPAHVGAAGGIAPFSIPAKAKGIKVGDDEEIITAIINAVQSSTKLDLEKCHDLKISSSFETTPDGTAVKAMAYRDPPGSLKAPNCYCFERVWKVEATGKDGELKTITLRKTIFTNIVIPLNSDAELLKDKETMAGIVAGTYASFVDTAVLVHAGKSNKYALDQITKIQKDQFLTMALFHNQDTLKPNKMKQGQGKVVTHVRLEFRAGKKDAKDENPNDAYAYIDLAKKVNNQSATLGQFERARKYVLVPDDSSSPEIKELAELQKFRHLQEEFEAGKDPAAIRKDMKDKNIDVDKAAEMCRTENRGLERTFEDRLNLFTESSRIVTVRNLYGSGTATKVSDTLQAVLPKSGKPTKVSGLKSGLKRIFEKSHQNEDFGVLKKLIKHQNDKGIKDEAKEYIGYYRQAYKEMKKLHEKITKNEDLLFEISMDDQEVDQFTIAREERENILQEIKDILSQEPSSEEFEEDNSSIDFSTVKKSDEEDDRSLSSEEGQLTRKKKKVQPSGSSSYETDETLRTSPAKQTMGSFESSEYDTDDTVRANPTKKTASSSESSSEYISDEATLKPKKKTQKVQVENEKKPKSKGRVFNPPKRKLNGK